MVECYMGSWKSIHDVLVISIIQEKEKCSSWNAFLFGTILLYV